MEIRHRKSLVLIFTLIGLTFTAVGAADPPAEKTAKRAGKDWWALQPVKKVEPPATEGGDVRNPIDAFIVAGLKQRGLAPSPPADKRSLLRRVTYDLVGLPPTFEQIQAFVKDDSPDAYEKCVDRLLASPEYGVRWARHWLDAARFGESDGFERDQPRPNAWRYRDWLVGAFNADMPYDRFARLQIAGDLISPEDAVATGFLVGGARDVVGETQQSAAMRAVVRQDQLEDIVGAVGQTFLGLTANCARCHDHKFDPISQREYFQLASALAGVSAGDRELSKDVVRAQAKDCLPAYERRLKELQAAIESIEKPARDRLTAARADEKPKAPPKPIAAWRFDDDLSDHVGSLKVQLQGDAVQKDGVLRVSGAGYASTGPLPFELKEKTLEVWVSLRGLQQKGGGVLSVQTLDGGAFDAIVFGEREPGRWMAGSEGYQRTMSFEAPAENEAADGFVHVAIVYQADGTILGYRNGLPYGRAYKSPGPVTFAAGKSQVLFGLRHLPAGGDRYLVGAIREARLYGRALSAAEVAASAGVKAGVGDTEVVEALAAKDRAARDVYQNEIDVIRRQQSRALAQQTYACVATASPGVGKVLARGDPASEREVVSPAGIAAVSGPDADFGLPPDAPDAQRRLKLAQWIADERNPLFARVIVNRLWLHHFGEGIVDTPNDFGFNGGKPSHPELLEWLAGEMRAGGWSIKKLQRLMVTSAAYRQSSMPRKEAMEIDASNRLLWRMSPHRIEAEAMRDSVLMAAGELNPLLGGPGFEDYYTFTQNTTFYEFRDYVGATFNRRSLYRNWIRSGRSPMLDVFDCPDPSTKTPRRAMTTTPLQALAMMNDSFILRMSDALAERVTREAGDDSKKQVVEIHKLVFGREPTDVESEEAIDFIGRHGLPAFARVLFNSNEFLVID